MIYDKDLYSVRTVEKWCNSS